MAYEVGWGIAAFFATLFQCSPVQSYWLIQSPVRDCGSTPALYYSTSSLNIFTDCTYLAHCRQQPSLLMERRFSPHLPVARERPRICSDLGPPTHYLDHHVLSGRHHLYRWAVACVVCFHIPKILGLPLYVLHLACDTQKRACLFSTSSTNAHPYRAWHRPLRDRQHRNLHRDHMWMSTRL